MIRKSKKYTPTNLQRRTNYYLMGDLFCRNLLVVQFPPTFNLGLLSVVSSNPNVKVNIVSEQIKEDTSKHLRKEYKELENEYMKSQDPTMKQNLASRLQSLDAYIHDIVNNNDRTHNFLMVFTITALNLEDLETLTRDFKTRINIMGFKVETLGAMQLDLLKSSTPLWIGNSLQKDLHYNLGVPLNSGSMAGLWGYIFETLKDPKGFLFGQEINNGGVIIWDPMLYINNPERRKEHSRLNGNIICVGTSGSGKTTDMNLIVRYFIREKVQICWIDPENKNQYTTEQYGGTFVNWGTKGSQINPFDLKPISSDEGDEQVNPWDTELAIYNVIDEFKTIIKLYKPSTSEDTLSMVGELVVKMYGKKGITYDTKFRYLSPSSYPILDDFMEELELRIQELIKKPYADVEINLLRDLKIKIKPMLMEHRYYFNGQTTIDVSNSERKIISFGTRNLIGKEKELKDALNYLMFRYAWSLCLDETQRSAFIIDEAHELILEGKSAEEIALFYRRSRKYNNSTILGTQETQDFASEKVIIHGKAIFNNSCYKIIKRLEKNAVTFLEQLMSLNETEIEVIKQFQQGDALFIVGERRIPMTVLATEKELEEMDPKRTL